MGSNPEINRFWLEGQPYYIDVIYMLLPRLLPLLALGLATAGLGSAAPMILDHAQTPRSAARPHQFGFNLAIMKQIADHGMDWSHSFVREATQRMQPRMIRWPGGSTSNNYLWREESYAEAVGDITGWVPGHVNAFIASGKKLGLQVFIDYCNEFGITPIYVYNSFEGDGQDLVDFVQHVEDLGGQVPYLEFANEPYWDPRSLNDVGPYLEMTRPLAAALKAFRPQTQIGICFAPHGNQANYEKIWNKPLMEAPYFDAVVHHEYHGKQGLGLEQTAKLTVQGFTHPEPILDQMATSLAAEASGFPVWLTEYNIGWDHLPQFAYTGAHGMYIASVFAWLNEHGDQFPIANYHQFYQDGFGTILIDDETREEHYTVSFYIWKLLGEVSRDATHVRPLPTGTIDLRVMVYESPDALSYLIINKSGTERDFIFEYHGDRLEGEWSGQQFTYPDLETKIPYDTDLTDPIAGEGAELQVPGYSISILRRDRP